MTKAGRGMRGGSYNAAANLSLVRGDSHLADADSAGRDPCRLSGETELGGALGIEAKLVGNKTAADRGCINVAPLTRITAKSAIQRTAELDGLQDAVTAVCGLPETAEVVGIDHIGAAFFSGCHTDSIDSGALEDGAIKNGQSRSANVAVAGVEGNVVVRLEVIDQGQFAGCRQLHLHNALIQRRHGKPSAGWHVAVGVPLAVASDEVNVVADSRQAHAALPDAGLTAGFGGQVERLGLGSARRGLGCPHADGTDARGLADGDEIARVVPTAAVGAKGRNDVPVELRQRWPLQSHAADKVAGSIVVGIDAIDENGKAGNILETGDPEGVHLVDSVSGAGSCSLPVAFGEEVHDVGGGVDDGSAGNTDPVGNVAAVAVDGSKGRLKYPLLQHHSRLAVKDANDIHLGGGDDELGLTIGRVNQRLGQPQLPGVGRGECP
ncbi:hypothetical protein CTA2_1255 [Colletotrichum tanaceti]|nr:hypothetical protein CTA2_1255 [Colletotrichum tanaceti]